jgi:plasmid stabilization system protein ParE
LTRRVAFRPQAEAELLEARAWYEERRPGLGALFAASVTSTVERIVETPLAYPRVHGETRRAVLRRFPYALYFRVLTEEVVILAVIHGRRRPDRWQSRS